MALSGTCLLSWRSSQSRRRTGVPPDALLPIELWDCIFQELPEDPLLRISTTCRAFNDLCMPIYLVRKGIPPLSLAPGDICIQSALIKALQLSFYIPPIECLLCRFWVFRVHEHMWSLRNLVNRTKSIRKLELIFHEELFQAASRPLDRVPYNPAVMNLFRDIVYCRNDSAGQSSLWAGRTSSPVVLVIYVAGNFTNSTSAAVLEIISIALSNPPSHPHHHPTPRRRFCQQQQQLLHSGAELSVVLPCITLPLLYTITLNTETIDPVVLSQFLARHKTLLSLEFDSEPPAAPARALITPAVTLPALHRINSSSPANVVRLLDALEWSPKLSNLGFSYDRSTLHSIAGLNVLLRRLGQRTRDVQLQLVLATSNMRPLDEEESAIASTLACVRSVQMNVLRQETAREILPWLALLPRFQLLDLIFMPRTVAQSQIQSTAGFDCSSGSVPV
ncbi:hypothetical protein B0H13DRAFT_2279073 [Mycena leptocephala]|nr:hypothetical protein B0H13DRAFT_2279073 [Mycena leptocephala]